MIYLFLADGFEDVEAIGTIDILRRCGLQVQTLSVSGKRVVTSAHGVVIKADSIFRKNHLLNCEAMVFPGGLKGAESMAKIRFAPNRYATGHAGHPYRSDLCSTHDFRCSRCDS